MERSGDAGDKWPEAVPGDKSQKEGDRRQAENPPSAGLPLRIRYVKAILMLHVLSHSIADGGLNFFEN